VGNAPKPADTRAPETIESEIEATRDRLAHTIDQLLDRPRAVQEHYPSGLGDGLVPIRGGYVLLEGHALAPDPIWPTLTSESLPRIDVDHEHPSRFYAFEPDLVDLTHPFLTQTPGPALIGDRRVVGAVADHPGAPREGRRHHVTSELGPLCREKEHLRPAIHAIGVEHELSNSLSERGPAGLTHLHDFVSQSAESGGECGRQSRLAAAITTL